MAWSGVPAVSTGRRRAISLVFVFPLLLASALASNTYPNKGASLGASRDSEPVVVSCATLAEFDGTPISELRLYRVDASLPGFVPIPFQIDEKVVRTFNEGTELEFDQLIYDYAGDDDGLLDTNDELVFMFRDGSIRAPAELDWPAGAAAVSYEIAIEDPRPGSPATTRWVYLFSGAGLPTSPESYVTWNGLPDGLVSTARFDLAYEGNWLLTELRVADPCGDEADLIDRFKGRAQPLEGNTEDEEGWNSNSVYLGALLGPVRVIRGIRGAMSAVNTIHQDIVSEALWERRLHLRVHPLPRAWFYFDWLPRSETYLYTSNDVSGVVVDGQPDDLGSMAAIDWSVISGPGGGLGVVYEVPDSPLYASRELYYRDDASYDDRVPSNPLYPDDDDGAFGALGLDLLGIEESNLQPVFVRLRGHPLCSGEGDQQVGERLEELAEYPLEPEPQAQYAELSPVTELELTVSGDDISLTWEPRPHMVSYRVFASPSPDLARESWDFLGSAAETSYVDEGQALVASPRVYSVVGVTADGEEGPW